MPSERERILQSLYRKEFLSGEHKFTRILQDVLPEALAISGADAEQFALSNETRFWNALLISIENDRKAGRHPVFHVRDRRAQYCSCYAHELCAASNNRSKHVGIRLLARPRIIRTIDSLTYREYEALGCVASQLVGAREIVLTPRGNDAGIDFFALVDFPGRSHVFHGATRPLRVIGQSKMYASRVDNAEIKEFVQTITQIREQNRRVERLVPVWFRNWDGPIIGWFVAHAGFKNGAVQIARDHGIVLSDSRDIAEIVATTRVFDICNQPIEKSAKLIEMIRDRIGVS